MYILYIYIYALTYSYIVTDMYIRIYIYIYIYIYALFCTSAVSIADTCHLVRVKTYILYSN